MLCNSNSSNATSYLQTLLFVRFTLGVLVACLFGGRGGRGQEGLFVCLGLFFESLTFNFSAQYQ